MKIAAYIVAAGALAAAGISVAASALDGIYVAPSGTKLTVGADTVNVEIPGGPPPFDVPYVVEGDTFTFNAVADDPTCPGQTGVYTFVEDAASVTFTAVSDDCEARKTDVTAGAWTKFE